MTYIDATTFCQGSEMKGYGGFTDWRLPNIDELKTLIINPNGTPRTKNCAVSEATGHLSYRSDFTCSTCTEACIQSSTRPSCSGCNFSSEGIYSKLGDVCQLWSSSLPSDYSYSHHYAWLVSFDSGSVSVNNQDDTDSNLYVRCVR